MKAKIQEIEDSNQKRFDELKQILEQIPKKA
jgi:hypothetical protein